MLVFFDSLQGISMVEASKILDVELYTLKVNFSVEMWLTEVRAVSASSMCMSIHLLDLKGCKYDPFKERNWKLAIPSELSEEPLNLQRCPCTLKQHKTGAGATTATFFFRVETFFSLSNKKQP